MPSRRTPKAPRAEKAKEAKPARPRLRPRDDMRSGAAAQLFSSLFKAEGEKREDMDWHEFVKAMGRVGFGLDSGGRSSGSGVGFRAPEHVGAKRMRLDNPHGPRDGILRAAEQNSLAKRLNEHFELEAYIAKLRVEAQQPPPDQQPPPQP